MSWPYDEMIDGDRVEDIEDALEREERELAERDRLADKAPAGEEE